MQVRIYRHGESVSNAGGRTDDPALIPLTDVGKAQSISLARALPDAPDLLLLSPFLRSSETAEPIRDRFPVIAVETWAIQEFTYLSPAACVGTSWVERKPWIDAYWRRLDPDFIHGPGAESFSQLLGRVRTFLERLDDQNQCEIIAISHGQFMQATKLLAEQPRLDAETAMRLFVERQARAPFLNCGKLQLARRGGQISVG